MTANATATNGPARRKQLSEQLDRLDGIIDCLATNLNEAVADACREGARQAVREAVMELLTNPDLRAMLAGLAPPSTAAPPPPPESVPARPPVWSRVRAEVSAATGAVAGRCRSATHAVSSAARTLSSVMPVRKILLIGLGVGVAVGVMAYACPHGMAAVLSGVGMACAAVAAQVGAWVRRSARSLGLAGTG